MMHHNYWVAQICITFQVEIYEEIKKKEIQNFTMDVTNKKMRTDGIVQLDTGDEGIILLEFGFGAGK